MVVHWEIHCRPDRWIRTMSGKEVNKGPIYNYHVERKAHANTPQYNWSPYGNQDGQLKPLGLCSEWEGDCSCSLVMNPNNPREKIEHNINADFHENVTQIHNHCRLPLSQQRSIWNPEGDPDAMYPYPFDSSCHLGVWSVVSPPQSDSLNNFRKPRAQ